MIFDPQKSLFNLSIVRRTFATTLLLAIFTAAVIAIHEKRKIAFDGESFNVAIEIFRMPLGILAIGLTSIGIFGANHRSEQTKRQIERNGEQIQLTTEQIAITQGQNRFSNYYKHLEEFEKYCLKNNNGSIIISNPRALYREIFPKSQSGTYEASISFIADFEKSMGDFVALAEELYTPEITNFRESLGRLARYRLNTMRTFHLGDGHGISGHQHIDKNGTIVIPNGNSQSTLNLIILAIRRLDEILQFDLNYKSPDIFHKISNVPIEKIPSKSLNEGFEMFSFASLMDNR